MAEADKTVAIVGLGYVGLPLALLTAKKGFETTGIDLNTERIEKIKGGQDPIGDEYVASNLPGTSLQVASNFDAIPGCQIVIICVPTPVTDDFMPDLNPVKAATKSVAERLQKGSLVIIESTINPGVCDDVVIPLIEEVSGLTVNQDFFVSHCPERINPGDPKWNVENINRVAGSSNAEGLARTVSFYESIIEGTVKPMGTIKEAEAVKVVENSFRDINIAFVNELAMSFTKLGINVTNVIDGAATKPFSFMAHYPSVGVGGHCIPVDPYYLIEYAKGQGFDHDFLQLARDINNHMPAFTVERLGDGLQEAELKLQDITTLILGLSYKANVADDRESPSYKVIDVLKGLGANVITFDPYILDKSSEDNIESALEKADAIVVAAGHKEFLSIDPTALHAKVVVDGKNCLDMDAYKDAGIVYRGIGRQ